MTEMALLGQKAFQYFKIPECGAAERIHKPGFLECLQHDPVGLHGYTKI